VEMGIDSKHNITGITLNNIGKKFRDQWIFRKVDLEIINAEKIAITGFNGSGKSTLLQMLAGYVTPSEGTIHWKNSAGPIPTEQVYNFISFASPYMELIEEFTLEENVSFFSSQKKLLPGISADVLIEKVFLHDARKKQVKHFSSGMKQRIKLALAFCADTPLLLLDEPLSNLDASGYNWYKQMLEEVNAERIVIICSNQLQKETFCCKRFINIEDYK